MYAVGLGKRSFDRCDIFVLVSTTSVRCETTEMDAVGVDTVVGWI